MTSETTSPVAPVHAIVPLPPVPFKPYYQDERCTIYNADCRQVLPFLPKVDLLLTDPPYGHGDKWSGGTWAANPMYEAAFKWDAEKVRAWLVDWLIESAETSIIWGGNYYNLPGSRCWLSWEKTSRMPTMADFELAWTNMDKPSKSYVADRNPDGKRVHPTQKPVGLLKWCLGFLPEAKTVLDPYMGSGTTLVACKAEGRHAIGIDISEQYCESAAKRLSQGTLF
jgi:DNA modification methylase